MIKFEKTEVMNFEGALRGMRNPLNSWDKSDSEFDCENNCDYCQYRYIGCSPRNGVYIGENDLDLAQRLIKAGPDHRKFLRQIFVSVDITAPLYWWKEFDTYKVGTVSNSCSTMHKIHAKEFTLDDFSHEQLKPNGKAIRALKITIETLNEFRDMYNNGFQNVEPKNKVVWYQMIQLLPTSYNQKRTITLTYETLRNIYGSRRNHKLDEWSKGFMEWIDSLPYAEELIKF